MTRIISTTDRPFDEAWPRQLARRSTAGELLRIRHGCYVEAASWSEVDDEARYLVTLDAVRRTAKLAPVFGGESAGVLWGLPRPALPAGVHVVVPIGSGRRSANGVTRLARVPAAPDRAAPHRSATTTGHQSTGLRRRTRHVPGRIAEPGLHGAARLPGP